MSILVKQLKNIINLKEVASNSLDQYYQKVAYANRYRFRSRLRYKTIQYPPTLDGNEDFVVSTQNEENDYIKKILNVKPHPEAPLFQEEYSLNGPPKGRIYEKIPFKFKVEKDKAYLFCTCGWSNNQPFCDGTHKMLWTTHLIKKMPKYRPMKYVAKETKDVWFCNCKQSSSRPFCDGTHKTDEVQKATSVK